MMIDFNYSFYFILFFFGNQLTEEKESAILGYDYIFCMAAIHKTSNGSKLLAVCRIFFLLLLQTIYNKNSTTYLLDDYFFNI